MRSDRQILDETNELARRLYWLRGHAVAVGYRFDLATHPQELEAWCGACVAQALLTATDPKDAAENLADDADESGDMLPTDDLVAGVRSKIAMTLHCIPSDDTLTRTALAEIAEGLRRLVQERDYWLRSAERWRTLYLEEAALRDAEIDDGK